MLAGKWEDVFVVAGPTASGKSELAIRLAEAWDAEIVSADAYQIYRGLAVLTAQPSGAEQARVPHHLVNQIGPEVEFSAADFAAIANVAIRDIRQRNRRIILAGGAGFYLEALLVGLPATPPPDPELRERLKVMSLPELIVELERLDPAAAMTVDLQNPRRVQRAIEVVAGTGRPFASFARQSDATVRGLVLHPERDVLLRRIEERTDRMLNGGAIEEVRLLGPCSRTCGQSIGIAEIEDFLHGKITLPECRERIIIATRQYAKRQMTWFRNRSRWELVEPSAAVKRATEIFEG